MSPRCLDEWRLIVVELDAGAEVCGGAWRSRRRGGRLQRMEVAMTKVSGGAWSLWWRGGLARASRRWMERSYDRRCDSGRGPGSDVRRVAQAGKGRSGWVRPCIRMPRGEHFRITKGEAAKGNKIGKKTFRSVRFSTGASRNEERFYCQLSGTEWVVEATRTRLHAMQE